MPDVKLPSPLSSDSIGVLFALLPGLLTFLVARALTNRSKKIEATEAVLYGLAYTLLVHAVWSALALLPFAAVPATTGQSAAALFLGVCLAWIANKGWLYGLLRWLGITREAAASSTWLAAFEEASRYGIDYAVLHLNDGRRLYGNVRGVSDEPTDGHVVLGDHAWLQGNEGGGIDMLSGFVVIRQSDILLVEFVPFTRR